MNVDATLAASAVVLARIDAQPRAVLFAYGRGVSAYSFAGLRAAILSWR